MTGGKTNWPKWFRIFPLIISVFLAQHEARAQGQEIRIAAAADLQFAMGELTEKFEKQSGTRVNATYGSSGNLFSQLQNGAPFDLFFSADMEYPKKLEAAGLAEPGRLYKYEVGRIVIWTPADAWVDVAKQGWVTLLDAIVKKIAIANPEHAPYGRAAVAALQNAGICESLKSKLVYGEKYFASGAVCTVGKRAGGDCGDVAGGFAGDARWETLGDSGGNVPGDPAGRDFFEGRKE